MKSFVLSDIQKLAFDAGNKIDRAGMSKEDVNEAIRNAVREACGGDWNPYAFKKNAQDVFALLAEIMPVNMRATLGQQLDSFCDFRDEALGDKTYFTIYDRTVFKTLTVATGTKNITRVKLEDTNFKVDTKLQGIRMYDELDSFMRGNMDFARLNEKATEAMSQYVGELVASTIYGAYSSIKTRFKATGSYDASTLSSIIKHIKSENGVNSVQIFGNEDALANIADQFGYSDNAKDQANKWGYYGTFRGTDLIALPQSYVAGEGSTDFAVDSSHVIIVPKTSDKIVKVVFEGEVIVDMNNSLSRTDLQQEILFMRRIGAAAITAVDGRYGMYKFE